MKQKGFSSIIILLVCAAIFVAAAAGAYYFLKFTGKTSYGGVTQNEVSQISENKAEISTADDSETIKAELDSTQIDPIDSDLQNLETQASSL